MSRRSRRLGAAVAAATVAGLLTVPPARAEEPVPATDPVAGLPLPAAQAVAHGLVSGDTGALGGQFKPVGPPPRILLVTTGVDVAALPAAFADQVTVVDPPRVSTPDPVGYGTWAASVLLQYLPDATIESASVYPWGHLDVHDLYATVKWVYDHGTERGYDTVLFALPPHDLVDPVSLAREPSSVMFHETYRGHVDYDELVDTLLDYPIQTADGPNLGTSGSIDITQYHYDGASVTTVARIQRWRQYVTYWRAIRTYAAAINGKGIPLVVPAGDLGRTDTGTPRLQSIHGLGNLPELITVGAADGPAGARRVVPTSSNGPGMDGRVKPDLVAPTGAIALLPPAGRITATFPGLSQTLQAWTDAIGAGWEIPSTTRRGPVNSTLVSAAVVAAGAAALHRQGVTEVARIRGALTAAAEPIAGVPVWRQGAGVLEHAPTVAEANGTVLGGNADLGMRPASGEWAATVPVIGGVAATGTTSGSSYAGLDADGRNVTRDLAIGAGVPVTATPVANGLKVQAAPSNADAGFQCGFVAVPLPAVNRTEQLPSCLVQPFTFVAESRYIHNRPAANTTWMLTPALPPTAAGLLDRPLEMLPIDPLHVPLHVAEAVPGGCREHYADYPKGYPRGLDYDFSYGDATCAVFPLVAPGYYTTRLFADYGTPVGQTDNLGLRLGDIGSSTAYQKLPMFVLPTALDREREPVCATDLGCKEGQGKSDAVYTYDKATDTFVLGPNPDLGLRFAYGHVKRIVGANVSGRVIDLIDYDAVAEGGGFAATTASELTGIDELGGLPVSDDLSAWRWQRVPNDPTAMLATFNPLHSVAGKTPLGVARYEMNLPQPNYTMHLSADFHYRLTDALLVVWVQAGDEHAYRILGPAGKTWVTPPPGTGLQPLAVDLATGTTEGDASLKFLLKPKGAPKATVTFYTVPYEIRPVTGGTAWFGNSVLIGKPGFQYDTWTNADWPSVRHCLSGSGPATASPDAPCPAGTVEKPLHVFSVRTNHSVRQMRQPCREADTAKPAYARVCEDWEMLVHTPLHDARVYDVVAGGTVVTDRARALGAERVDPGDRTTPMLVRPLFELVPNMTLEQFRAAYPFNGSTTNVFWENLALPKAFAAAYPDTVTIRIEDNVAPTADEPVAPRSARSVREVAPYVCAVNAVSVTGSPLL